MSELDPDRTIALAYVPARHRAALEALFRLDLALGAAIAGGREPMIARIKLAWWREALERLDIAPPPAEPVLEALAAHVLPRGLTGATLSRMEAGWAALTDPLLGSGALARHATERGARLFAAGALLLGGEGGDRVSAGGEVWALVDVARRTNNPAERDAALSLGRQRAARARESRWPAALRPLGMLAMVALRDLNGGRLERGGSPGRLLRMARHRLTGR